MTMNLSWQERDREREKETDSQASENSFISHGRGQGHVPQNTSGNTQKKEPARSHLLSAPKDQLQWYFCDP